MTDQRVHGAYTEVLRQGAADQRVQGFYTEVLRSVATDLQTQQVHGFYTEVLRSTSDSGGSAAGWPSGGRVMPVLPDARR